MLVQCTLRMPRMHSERERIAPPCAPSQDALVLIPCDRQILGQTWPDFRAIWPTSPTQDEQCSPPYYSPQSIFSFFCSCSPYYTILHMHHPSIGSCHIKDSLMSSAHQNASPQHHSSSPLPSSLLLSSHHLRTLSYQPILNYK